MFYEITYTKDALKALRKMPRNVSALIISKIERLTDGGIALAANIKKLQGRAGYRLRVGDYRVIYSLDDGRLIITVIKIAPRGGVYE